MKLHRHLLVSLLAVAAAVAQVAPVAPVTLTPPALPEKAPDADGFLQRWLLLEPIESNGLTDSAVQAAVKKEYFPDQLTVVPKDGDKVTVGGAQLTWHAVDTRLYNVNLYHFAYALGKPTSNVLFWAVTVVNAPQEMTNVRLAIGSNAASVWWVNGQEVIGIYGDRQTVIDDGVSKRLTLKRGANIVRAAIINGGGATDFCARFLDSDDKPIKSVTVRLSGATATPPASVQQCADSLATHLHAVSCERHLRYRRDCRLDSSSAIAWRCFLPIPPFNTRTCLIVANAAAGRFT
jgi:hypothetical protein